MYHNVENQLILTNRFSISNNNFSISNNNYLYPLPS